LETKKRDIGDKMGDRRETGRNVLETLWETLWETRLLAKPHFGWLAGTISNGCLDLGGFAI
jgi:hypothetical protein